MTPNAVPGHPSARHPPVVRRLAAAGALLLLASTLSACVRPLPAPDRPGARAGRAEARSQGSYRDGARRPAHRSGRQAPGSRSGVAVPVPSRLPAEIVEADVLQLVNRYRRRHRLAGLVPDPQLTEIARRHSRAMRDQEFFAHRDPAGRGLVHRLRRGGVVYRAAGENLAAAYRVAEPSEFLHDLLVDSQPHRANLLDPRFTRVGIGVARRGTSYWLTQVFVLHMPRGSLPPR